MTAVWLVFWNEITGAIRDRRTLITTILIPLVVLPLTTTGPLILISRRQQRAREYPSRYTLTDGLRYPELEQALQSSPRLTYVAAESSLQALRSSRLDVAVEVRSLPEGLAPGEVNVVYDATRPESRTAADKVRQVVSEVSGRLVARQVDTTKVNLNPLRSVVTNVASKNQMTGYFLGLLVGMMVVIGLLIGSMATAIDTTAGEKERRTLEGLLAAPIGRGAVLAGKFLATLASSIVSVVLIGAGYAAWLSFGMPALLPGSDQNLGALKIVPAAIPLVLLVALVMATLAAAIGIALGIFARTPREAQTYATPLYVLAFVPMILAQSLPPSPPDSLFLIPLFNVVLLVRELLMGSIVVRHVLSTLLVLILLAAAILRLARELFGRESVVLRQSG